MENEVKPLPAATVEVSPKPAVKLARPTSAMKKRAADRTPEESAAVKQYQNENKRTSRPNVKARKKIAEFVFDSPTEPKASEAKEILAARGLKNPHVINKVYELLLREAEDHQIPANRFLFANGIVQTLRSQEAKKALPLDTPEAASTEFIQAELLTSAELFALYDASIATHEDITFEEFLSVRLRCKADTYYLGKDVFQNDFAHCHEVWRDFFPKWNPLTLPPNYTQKQAIDWLASQSEIKDFLLMASRRAFKSSFARLWLVSAIVTMPDLRVLIVSETRPLAKDNIEAVRGYFETTPGFETRFQRLFPEFQIPVGDGSAMSLEVPMRRLKLPQSVESSSMDSTVAGRRADIILFDDPISEVSCTNEVQIQKSVNKRDLLVKLKERGGYVVSLGTPYAATDLYFQMIERSKKNADETFAYRVDPAFQVKPEAFHKLTPALLPTLEESDIESFLFPEGLSWKELRIDMRNNPPFFMSQNLCIFPLEEDAELRVQFDINELRARTRGATFFGSPIDARVVMSLDRAWSLSKYADRSVLTVGKVQSVEGKQALVIASVKADRWRESELVRHAVEMIEQWHPTLFISEQDRGWESLAAAIREGCLRKNIPVPYFRWKVIQPADRLKARRAKDLELPLSSGRLWFFLGPWNDYVFDEFQKFDGVTRSNSSRKDDSVDGISIMYAEVGPKYQEETKPEEEEQREQQLEEEAALARRQEMYHAMFSSPYTPPPPTPESQEPPRPVDPRDRIFSYRKSVATSKDRQTIFGAKGKWQDK